MQPYFLPYVGYFQLIGAVDLFILHDDIKYTKKGWINRNRILQNGRDAVISLPLKAGADALHIRDREIAEDFRRDRLLNRIREAYLHAPHFEGVWPLVRAVIDNSERNLFEYLRRSLELVCENLGLRTPMRRSSEFAVPYATKGQDRVIALCKEVGATVYLNPIGGTELTRATPSGSGDRSRLPSRSSI